VDWLHFSNDVQKIMGEYWKTVDTVLMGRKTWEFAAAQGENGGGTMGNIKTYIFSRTLETIDRPGVEVVKSDAGEFVKRLKREKGKGICVMGGGELAGSLLAAGVVDEVGMNMHPVLLGSGIPLFGNPGRRVPLTLKECRTLSGGCVYAIYRVKPLAGAD